MDKQSINTYIADEVCIADKLCNKKNPNRKQTINFCEEYLDGFNDDYLKNLCEKYTPTECKIEECTIYLPDHISSAEGTVTTSFRDVIVLIKGVEPILRFPPLYPKDCKKFGSASSEYANCPCCFCNDRNASGSGVPDGQPMIPGRNKCINNLSGGYDLVYFPKSMQEIKLNESIINPITELSVGKGKRITVDARKIIDIPNDFVWFNPQLLIDFLIRKDVRTGDIEDIFNILKPEINIKKELDNYYETEKNKKLIDKKIDLSPVYKYLTVLILAVILILLF